MLELIFVIVVIGIIIAVVKPNTERSLAQQAAVQLASHLRYTQHLAMADDRYDATNARWHRERWQLVFSSSAFTGGGDVWAYTIFSDTAGGSTGDADHTEVARNPENTNQLMSGGYGDDELDYTNEADFIGMKKLNIGKTYDIIGDDAVKLEGGCSDARISFDHLGRPFTGDQSSMGSPYNNGGTQRLITEDCTITLDDGTDSIVLHIAPETGYVSVVF